MLQNDRGEGLEKSLGIGDIERVTASIAIPYVLKDLHQGGRERADKDNTPDSRYVSPEDDQDYHHGGVDAEERALYPGHEETILYKLDGEIEQSHPESFLRSHRQRHDHRKGAGQPRA